AITPTLLAYIPSCSAPAHELVYLTVSSCGFLRLLTLPSLSVKSGQPQFVPDENEFAPGGDKFVPRGDKFVPDENKFVPGENECAAGDSVGVPPVS
ncbi:MAG TPA: hypothetical protein VGG02_12595, partial [Chthoniobacterales bacterium]